MREIKFRVWDTKRKQWINPGVELVPHLSSDNYKSMYLNVSAWSIASDLHVVFLQYTGLKDKNGKEIYDGDICKYLNTYREPQIIEIMWMRIGGMTGFTTPTVNGIRSPLEVIGNIYDNPKLLQGS